MSENNIYELEMAKGIVFNAMRIGYKDEGLRLTFFNSIPFKFHVEIQLSKNDIQQLIEVLQDGLNNWKE